MKQIMVCKTAEVSTYNQFKVKVLLELSKDEVKSNLYHMLIENESWIWDYLERMSVKLGQK